MADWGQGVINNDIGWGKGFNNNIGWGSVYAVSFAGQTVISQVLNVQSIVDAFKLRVAADLGTFEGEANLVSILTTLQNTQ
jgi:hypothetical protein